MRDVVDEADDLRVEVLTLTDEERALGAVAGRKVTWGVATVVMLKHADGFLATGATARRPHQTPNACLAESYGRARAMRGLQAYSRREKEPA